MKKTEIRCTMFIATAVLILSGSMAPLSSKLLYTQTEYTNLYNEKVSVELELKSLMRQHNNEKTNLETRIKSLENDIENLNRQIALLNEQNSKDKNLCDDRIKELQGTIDILQKKSSNREQDLIDENKKLQARYEDELKRARQQLTDERNRYLKDMDDLNKKHADQVSKFLETIKNLNEELSSLKKLTQSQKNELQRMADQANELEKQLAEEIKLGQIRLKKFHNKLIINIDDRISFDSGSADLKKEIMPALEKITDILVKYSENRIMVEGHTDNIPIKTKKFRDNWQLSTERALSVLDYILKNKKLNNSRFGAAGYGEFNPIVANDTPENRSLNRRVDIVLIPRIEE
jgi:chemotaxis protein MotB